MKLRSLYKLFPFASADENINFIKRLQIERQQIYTKNKEKIENIKITKRAVTVDSELLKKLGLTKKALINLAKK